MDQVALQFDLTSKVIERTIDRLAEATQRALASGLPRGLELAKHFDAACDAVRARLAEVQREFVVSASSNVRDDALVEVIELLGLSRVMFQTNSWLAERGDTALDLGTTLYLERLARVVTDSQVELTVVPTKHGGYQIYTSPFRDVIEKWGTSETSPITPIVVLVPSREAARPLLHPLVIHELGHAADSINQIVEDLWTTASTDTEIVQRFRDAAQTKVNGSSLSESGNHLAQIFRRWISELWCDALATCHLGPSYLFAFVDEVYLIGPNLPTQTHPPPSRRVSLILDVLDRTGWTAEMEASTPCIKRWMELVAAQQVDETADREFLLWAMEELVPSVVEKARETLGDGQVAPESAKIAPVVKQLRNGIPAAQDADGHVIDGELAILSCWNLAFELHGESPEAISLAVSNNEIAELLPVSLELGAVARAWGDAENAGS